MVDMDQGELLASLRGYLEELRESGVEELAYGEPAQGEAPGKAPVPVPTEAPAEVRAEAPALPSEDHPAFCVDGSGPAQARLLFLRPGAPLAPASEELLSRLVAAMGFSLADVYMLSFIADDVAAAGVREAVLTRITSVAPEVVVVLGESAARLIMKSSQPISALRGRFASMGRIAVMATLHPDQLVVDEGLKRQVWQEMRLVMARLAKSAA